MAALGDWWGLVQECEGLQGWERLRELSRLIGVAQPLAGGWLLAVPGAPGFRVRSDFHTIALQRRLGLPISMVERAAPGAEHAAECPSRRRRARPCAPHLAA